MKSVVATCDESSIEEKKLNFLYEKFFLNEKAHEKAEKTLLKIAA